MLLKIVTIPTAVLPTIIVVGEIVNVMVGETNCSAIAMMLLCVALGSVPLAACNVNTNEPAAVGVPLSTPLAGLSVRPGGSAPVAIDHVIGVVPLAVNVWLYALPVVPAGGAALVMDGATVATAMRMVTV